MADYLTRSDYKVMYPADYQDIVLQKIAEGQAVFGWADFTVAAGANVDFQLKTNGTLTHIYGREVTTSSEELSYSLYENPTLTDGTTAVNLKHLNRTMTSVDIPIDVYSDPTSVDLSGATEIELDEIFTADKKSTTTGGLAGSERILAPNTDYIFRFSNPTNSQARVFAKFFFYFWEDRYPQRILDR